MTFLKNRLAIVTTHPVQYQAHWFRTLATDPLLEVEVLYCHRATAKDQAAAGFGVEFEWDLPLLEGYPHRFLDNVARSPSASRFAGVNTPQLGPLLIGGKFDAVLVLGWHYWSAWQAFRTCWRNGIPVMARGDSHLKSPRRLTTKLIKSFPYRYFVNRLDACLAVGRWSQEYFQHYGAKPEKIFVVPHTIDASWFGEVPDSSAEKLEARGQWGFEADRRVFLYVGKFTPVKRPLDFVAAIAAADRGGLPVGGLMVGDGPLRRAAEELAASQGAPVHFAGFLNQSSLANVYSRCDALILPSESETWGLVVNEAMARGLPCLVSDRVGCGPDLVVTEETGHIYRMGDVDDLVERIRVCVEEPSVFAEMGGRARELARSQSAEMAAARLREAVDFVVRKESIVKRSAGSV